VVVSICLVGALVGAVCGRLMLRATPAGDDWHDWQRADLMGRTVWSWLVNALLFGALLVGLLGFGLPAWAQALLVGPPIGFLIPFAVEGVRRRRRRPPPTAASVRRGYRLPAAWELVGGATICALFVFVLGMRGVDLAVAAALGVWVIFVWSLLERFLERRDWF
jgi:hypothetical protein